MNRIRNRTLFVIVAVFAMLAATLIASHASYERVRNMYFISDYAFPSDYANSSHIRHKAKGDSGNYPAESASLSNSNRTLMIRSDLSIRWYRFLDEVPQPTRTGYSVVRWESTGCGNTGGSDASHWNWTYKSGKSGPITLDSTKVSSNGKNTACTGTDGNAEIISTWVKDDSTANPILKTNANGGDNYAVYFYPVWQVNQYQLDVNYICDGNYNSPSGIITFDVYINGSLTKSNVTDYYVMHDYGTTCRVVGKTLNSNYHYVNSNEVTGTVGAGYTMVDLRVESHNSSGAYYTLTNDRNATKVNPSSYCTSRTLYKWTYCSKCGNTTNVASGGTVKGTITSHNYSYSPATSSYCTGKTFTQTGTCSYGCGTTTTRSATGTRSHSWGSWSPASSGYCPGQSVTQTRSCTYNCGTTGSQTVAGTGSHNTSGSVINTSSSFSTTNVTRSNYCPGQSLYQWTYCTKCTGNASKTTIYGNGSHNTTKTNAVEPTCTADGTYEYWTCSKCSNVYSDSGYTTTTTVAARKRNALGHNTPTDYTVTTAATCTTTGTKIKNCTRCSTRLDTQTIAATGHQPMTHHAATVSTCTVHGNVDYYTCPQCSLNYSSGDTSASNTSTLNSIELPLDPDNHAWGEWVVVSKGNHGASGVQRRTCQNNASHYEDLPYDYMGDLKIAGASLSLHNNIAIRYRVAKTAFLNAGYTDPFIVFDLDGGRSETVTDYTIDGDYYIFKFSDIAPDFMNNTVRSTLYGSYGGKICQGEVKTYSIENYCYNMLHKSGYPANFYTLLVDILNYGAAAQSYTRVNDPSHNTADVELANYRITDMQSKGTSSAPTKTQINTVDALDGATVSQLGKQVVLGDSVSLRYYFELPAGANPADYKVKFKVPGLGKEYIKLIEQNAIGYYGFFNELNSGHMDQEVLVTVIDAGGSAVSSTSHYSIATYYAKNADSSNTLLANLVTAMMKYGDSAKAYAGY